MPGQKSPFIYNYFKLLSNLTVPAKNPPEVLIVDNFYPDLSWLSVILTNSTPQKSDQANYPGLIFIPSLDINNIAMEKIREHFELPAGFEQKGIPQIRLTVTADDNKFRSFVHADDSINVLVYLSGKEGPEYGTSFYRHRELGAASIHEAPIVAKKMAIVFENDTNDLDRWELIKQVPFKVNRAICFDGRFFHSIPRCFYGTDHRNGRITQNFFFARTNGR